MSPGTVQAFPLQALVGHEELREALLVNAVDPTVGGLLIRGEKGTAKSTAVRSLVELMPELDVVAECPFACDPADPDPDCPAGPHEGDASRRRGVRLVELPVGASADRITGSLDVERALGEGESAFDPGLLAAANRGVLYVDEVNLLGDHLVDLLLDAAAFGVNHVERDGLSVRHPARFLLVGTMNPEEGELRPQLLDRFGLSVEVTASRDPEERAEVVRRRLAFEADPAAFARRYESEGEALRQRLAAARESLPGIELPDRMVALIAKACARLEVDGLRADIVCAKAAVALAALEGSAEVERDHVRRAAWLALGHRRRRGPFESPGLDRQELDRALEGEETPDGDPPEDPSPEHDGTPSGNDDGPPPGHDGDAPSGHDRGPSPVVADPSGEGPSEDPPIEAPASGRQGEGEGREPAAAADEGGGFAPDAPTPERAEEPASGFGAIPLELARRKGDAFGRRTRVASAEHGRPVAERPYQQGAGLALVPTLFAAARHQRGRGRSGPGLALASSDLRSPVREGGGGSLLVVVLDASGSMAARRRMAAVKGALLELLDDAYRRRDLVALIAARGAGADLVVPPTASVELAAERIRDLRAGGRTPLGEGLDRAREVIRLQRRRGASHRPVVVLVTDGRANAGDRDPEEAAGEAAGALRQEGAELVVVDTEQGPVRLELARALAEVAGGAPVVPLDSLAPDAGRAA